MLGLTLLLRLQIQPPRALMRPLDLPRLCMSLLPRVLAILLPKNLANYLLLVLGRTVGSRFALDVWEIRPQRDCAPGWIRSMPRSPSIERLSTLPCPVRCLPLLTIIVIWMFSTPSMITCAVLLLSTPPRPDPSSRSEFRHSPQPGPSSRGDQRFASQDRPRPRDASSNRSHHRGISEDRSRKRFAASDHPGDRRRFASGDSPSPKRRRFASEDSPSPQHRRSSRASSGDSSFERPPSRSSPAHPSSPSREDRDPDDCSISAPVRAMVDYILQTFPESKASPSHPSSRSFDLSASADVTDVAIPLGSLLAWFHALSDSFTETQQRFARRIKDGKACHTLLPTLN